MVVSASGLGVLPLGPGSVISAFSMMEDAELADVI